MKNLPMANFNAKVGSKLCQIKIKYLKIRQKLQKSNPIGENSPNQVALYLTHAASKNMWLLDYSANPQLINTSGIRFL